MLSYTSNDAQVTDINIEASQTDLSISMGAGPSATRDSIELKLRQATQADLNANKVTLLFPYGAQ